MNILVVSPNLPSPMGGASMRNYQLLKILGREHTVSLLALAQVEACNDTTILESLVHTVNLITHSVYRHKRVRQLLNLMLGRPYLLDLHMIAEMQKALDELFTRNHYDVVLFESVLMAGYRVPQNVKVVIDQHNIEYELLQRTCKQEKSWLRKWYNWKEFRLLKPIEIERCRGATAVLTTSERERLLLKEMLPTKVIEVVPNGVDTEVFRRNDLVQEVADRIIFTGTLNYYPNTDAVLFFAQHCWPLIRAQIPGITWQIVGHMPPLEVQKLAELPGVEVIGSVPDMKPYLAAATLAIVPLRIGSGTRLKILEALAMQKAVVSTSLGCEGLSVVAGEHLIVADRAESFAQAVVDLMRNTEKRAALGAAGRALVESEYSWERSGTQLLRILEKIS